MSKGFVMLAVGEEYVKQAILCAMSIKNSGNTYPISVMTNDVVPSEYLQLFDKIIEIPWYENTTSRFATEHRWKIYHATPYEETIVLDTDILVMENLDYWWNFLNNYNVYFPTTVYTYRQDTINDTYYRKAFNANKLPNIYNVIYYFKKSDFAHEFFNWVELITKNWELFYGQYCKEHYPKQPSMDITFAIASKILDVDAAISNTVTEYPKVVHMKPKIQGWALEGEQWQDRVGVYLTDNLTLKIGNHMQNTIFHYTENSFVTDRIFDKFKKVVLNGS